jgi:hypothetical protein
LLRKSSPTKNDHPELPAFHKRTRKSDRHLGAGRSLFFPVRQSANDAGNYGYPLARLALATILP